MTQPDLVSKLLKYTYVDDIVSGAESEEAAYHLYKASKGLLCSAGLNLRKFTSNSLHLHQRIEGEEFPYSSDANSEPPLSSNANRTEESYTQATLGGSQRLLSG